MSVETDLVILYGAQNILYLIRNNTLRKNLLPLKISERQEERERERVSRWRRKRKRKRKNICTRKISRLI